MQPIRILCTWDMSHSELRNFLKRGFEIVSGSLITIKQLNYFPNPMNWDFNVNETETLVFTSNEAIETVEKYLKGKVSPNWKIYCLSGPSGLAAEAYFGSGSIAGKADNAAELSQKIIDDGIKKVIFLKGNLALPTLPDILEKAGIEVLPITVYETEMIRQKFFKPYDAILFSSPSNVRAFYKYNRTEPYTKLFAIGRTTAEEIANFEKKSITISPVPDKKEMLRKVIATFKKK